MPERDGYEDLRIEKLIDDKIKVAIREYDDDLQKALVNMFIIKLSKFESAYGVGKFVVVAVALLVIGTFYQIFVSLASSGVAK